jgi:lysyl-tRNA synthetase class 2
MADDWRPRATLATLRARARLFAAIRDFFTRRGLLEVETPQLSSAATSDPALHSLATHWPGPDGPRRFLHTSPELPMKRLLVAGSGDIWQLARVFRDGERGRLHHPEFTLLEWYRVGWDHRRLMAEVAELVTSLLDGHDLQPVEFHGRSGGVARGGRSARDRGTGPRRPRSRRLARPAADPRRRATARAGAAHVPV